MHTSSNMHIGTIEAQGNETKGIEEYLLQQQSFLRTGWEIHQTNTNH